MRIRHIVWKELWRRKAATLLLLGGLVLSVGFIVAVQRVQMSSRERLSRVLDAMGKNIVILPESATLRQYLAGDLGEETFPLSYLGIANQHGLTGPLVAGQFQGSLQRKISIEGENVVLCGVTAQVDPDAPRTGSTSPTIGEGQAELGWGAAERLGFEHLREKTVDQLDVTERKSFELPYFGGKAKDETPGAGAGPVPPWKKTRPHTGRRPTSKPRGQARKVRVTKVRPATGTIDDFKVYVDIALARRQLGLEDKVLNVIQAQGRLASEEGLSEIVTALQSRFQGTEPKVRVHHLLSIARARRTAYGRNARYMTLLSVAAFILGAMIIGGYAVADVRGRRKEMGILLAISARPGHVMWMFVQKMLILAVLGGVIGCWLGGLAAERWDPAAVAAFHPPFWEMYGLALVLAFGLTLVPSAVGVVVASRIDPADTVREL